MELPTEESRDLLFSIVYTSIQLLKEEMESRDCLNEPLIVKLLTLISVKKDYDTAQYLFLNFMCCDPLLYMDLRSTETSHGQYKMDIFMEQVRKAFCNDSNGYTPLGRFCKNKTDRIGPSFFPIIWDLREQWVCL
jgi:hypothetical protein